MTTTLLDLRRLLKLVPETDRIQSYNTSVCSVMLADVDLLRVILKLEENTFNVPDLIRIRDVIEKSSSEWFPIDGLAVRGSNFSTVKSNEILKKYYEDVRFKVNEALEKIDWTKYRR
jgi:hypothetical protein